MSAVSIADAWPATGQPFTVDDLDRLPDDGHRCELVDGVLVVSPAPTTPHQRAVARLVFLLMQACPRGLEVLPGPRMMISSETELIPDIVVVRQEHVGGAKLTEPALLAVEVQSPSTKLFDLNQKKRAYEQFGIMSYWIIDPDAKHPQLIVFELRGERYEQVAHVTDDTAFKAQLPFPVELVPAQLVADLPPE
jgi:Uma2 family endonuclease